MSFYFIIKMAKEKNSRLKNILTDLSSEDNIKVLTAIKQLRKHGKPDAIRPLVDLLHKSSNEEITGAIVSLFFDLQEQSVVEELILTIEDPTYNDIKPILLSIFWQSKLDGSGYLSTFIKEAISGDYLIGIEVMTIIDNFDSTFEEDEITNLKYDIDDAIMNEENLEKSNLLTTIKSSLENLNIEY